MHIRYFCRAEVQLETYTFIVVSLQFCMLEGSGENFLESKSGYFISKPLIFRAVGKGTHHKMYGSYQHLQTDTL